MDQHNRQRDRREIYSVYLNGTHYEMKVSEEGYKHILEIARETALCEGCRQHYSVENINVAGLCCLRCFLHSNKNLTFHGLLDKSLSDEQRYKSPYDPYDNPVYLFLDTSGHAHLTEAGPGESSKASENINVTLKYWHFPRPQQAEINKRSVDVREYGWTIYGDVIKDDVLILQHGCAYYKNELLFMVKRYGQAVQINRRKPMHRQMLADARAEIEATRNEHGMFWIDEEWQSWIRDSDVYRLAARRVSEELNTVRAEQKPLELPEQAEPERVTG